MVYCKEDSEPSVVIKTPLDIDPGDGVVTRIELKWDNEDMAQNECLPLDTRAFLMIDSASIISKMRTRGTLTVGYMTRNNKRAEVNIQSRGL
jgi:hypothetical protein